MIDLVKLASNFHQYFDGLSTDTNTKIDKSVLSTLAKTAANAFIVNNVPLNTTIMKLAKQENLNTEHLKRISEMANQEVFENLFNNSSDKNVHFELADPDAIIGKTASVKTAELYDLSSYKTSPKTNLEKRSSNENINWNINDPIVSEMSHANPKKDLNMVNEKLEATKEALITEKMAMAFNLDKAYEVLYRNVSEELGDTTFTKIAQVIYTTTTVDNSIKLLEKLSYDLMKKQRVSINEVNSPFSKTANLFINENHPIVKATKEYTKLAEAVEVLDYALQDIEDKLSKVANINVQSRKGN